MTNTERESINFKLPKTLTKVLRAVAKERNTTATDLVIQGLNHILGPVQGTVNSVETRLHQIETQLTLIANRTEAHIEDGINGDFKQKLLLLEQKTESLTSRLAQIERVISSQRQRSSTPHSRQYNPYRPPQVQLQAYMPENLAKRLGIDLATLEREYSKLSPKDFDIWCRSRDPGSIAWRKGDDGLFHPVK